MEGVFPEPLRQAIKALAFLPGLGEKSATRLALYLVRRPERAEELAAALRALSRIKLCRECGNFTEAELCGLCASPDRDRSVICVVEDPAALSAIESAGVFHGRYHVLHGVLSPRDGLGPEELRIPELLERVRKDNVQEVLIGLSPTAAGEATAAYIVELLNDLPVRVTRLACGLALGMEVRYADHLTLKRALLSREVLK
ncbi:recombination mediator RecR [Thermosulfurimonas dismutans]|uniref:Recombination protein RecR n=1 Tax=Thermosulfurimonas dismutans TaxID=999894 RepID=A0A179D455_9BACT|nr:recombination mediator RecR [Thermosulfurimonas dismutans]OAQ20408.1 Recombination protein RecR [Thermosulfurimonas dismutans]